MLDLAALVARLESAARALDDACAEECPVHLLSEMTELHEAIAALDEARSRAAAERKSGGADG